MKKAVAVAILAMFVGACSKQHGPDSTLTEAQRDSVLARSVVPGAGAIGVTMSMSQRESNRDAALNAMVDSLPR